MKLTLNKNEFKKHLDKVINAIPSATALPSLYGIVIKANGSGITLIASDGNLSIKEEIISNENIKVEIPGDILIPGKLFKDVIGKHGNSISIETNEVLAKIESSEMISEINLLNLSDYPVINFDIIGKEITLEAEVLEKAIKNVSFAAAENDKRIILNGVNFSSFNGKLTVAATNSYRLAKEEFDINSNAEFNITLLSKNLKEFLPKNTRGEIKMQVDNTKVLTIVSSTTTSSKLIDGVYPEVKKLIPVEFEHEITIDSKEMVSLIEKATVVSETEKKIVKLSVNLETLSLESKRREMGSTIASTTKFSLTGKHLSIPFNSQFLKEAVSKFDGEIILKFVGEQKPFIVQSKTNDKILQLILPHRSF